MTILYYNENQEGKLNELLKISNPKIVQKKLNEYIGKDTKLYISSRKNSKYMIIDPNNKWTHFGSFNPPMEDFTYHNDPDRRKRYLARAMNIKGNWKNNKYSPNNLSINVLW